MPKRRADPIDDSIPESARTRSVQILVRCTPDEAAIVRANALGLGLTDAAYLRLMIRTLQAVHVSAEARTPKPPPSG